MRVVLDTNVLLSALFARGVCEAILDAWVDRDDRVLVLSDHILEEFTRHASRKFGAPPAEARAAVDFLRRNAELVQPAPLPASACRDTDDLPVLGTAVAGRADALVTGDADLLVLQAVEKIPILSPREFLDRFC